MLWRMVALRNAGLRTRMLFILLLATIPGMVVAVFLTVQQLREETRQIENSVNRLAALAAARHENVIANARVLLKAVVEAQQLNVIADSDCQAFLKGWIGQFTYFTSLTLFDSNGRVVCKNTDDELPYAAGNQDWFEKTKSEKKFVLSDYQIDRNGAPILVASLPVLNKKKAVIGIIAVGISLDWLKFLAGTVALPASATITVLGPRGHRLTHYDGKVFNFEATSTQPSEVARTRIFDMKIGILRSKDQSGATRVYGFSATQLGGIVVVVGLPQFVEYAEWRNALFETLLSPLAVLLLALGAAAWASEALVVRHVRSMITTAEEITSGNLRARSDVDYDEHELGQLAEAMDTMADEIEEQQEKLKERSEVSSLIAREMQHRIGNTLTLARIIAAQTLKNSDSDEEFLEVYGARIQALSVSNQTLLDGDWKSANLEHLLLETLSIHLAQPDKQVEMRGPKVELGPKAVLAITLAVHELSTNSLKYGALSKTRGRVTIDWTLEQRDQQRWLTITWQETGAETTSAPNGEGFGSRLMKSMIEGNLRGRLERVFAVDGLKCIIAVPL
jgi:two-component sensor histidine kinase